MLELPKIYKNISIPLAYMQSLVKFLIAHHQPSIKLEQEQQKNEQVN